MKRRAADLDAQAGGQTKSPVVTRAPSKSLGNAESGLGERPFGMSPSPGVQ